MIKNTKGKALWIFGFLLVGVIGVMVFWVERDGWRQLSQIAPNRPLQEAVMVDAQEGPHAAQEVAQQLPPDLPPYIGLKEAMFWEELPDDRVLCNLCFRRCVIPAGGRGVCRVRGNYGGRLYSLIYARPSTVMIDPIEKEPQLHHRPGTEILCVGTVGCNFRCKQCQNWSLSQASPGDLSVFDVSPEQLVELARQRGVTAISFTYNDPIVLFEYVYDTAVLAKEAGVGLILHTNGAIAEEPLRKLLPYTTAITIDLKGFCEEVYRETYDGDLSYVLRTLKIIREEGVWLEIVNLVIPTINDCMDQIRAMSEWIVENLGPDVPLHFSRFHPAYRLTHLPATPVRTLEEARETAVEAGVNFATIGNVPGHRYNSTFCPDTGERLIHRVHFTVLYNKIVDGRSPFSGQPVPGIW
ncbi:MAG TPA: AmmeMemoRadiSam system radical SAM enzyme [Atribacteraceae bacterium]|nr:AmmeMemoRadiSam system radical SAM enzyme [Atribacteraceae bacterium]